MSSGPAQKFPGLPPLPVSSTQRSPLSVVAGADRPPPTQGSQSGIARPDATRTMTSEDAASDAKRLDVKYLIRALLKYSASDLHLKVDRPPLYRINGKLVPAKMTAYTREEIQGVIYSLLSQKQVRDLEEKRNIDFSFHVKDCGRFRCNVYFQKGAVSAAVRMVPMNIPNVDELGLPAVLKDLCQRPRGLILVTGATGSGKSTTMAAMIQYINENRHVHVLSIEDPIEYVYRDLKASITQREIGSDAYSIQDALISGLRQDPDVIVIGEMRDQEMIQSALTAAETGHLVLSTLHTNDTRGTIDRILDVFPGQMQNQIRIQLASTLVGVVSQQLLVRADGSGRVPACEIMVKSPTIESYILKNELDKIPEAISGSNNYYRMQTMNQAIERLIKSGAISQDEGVKASLNPDDLKLRLSGITRDEGYESKAADRE